jgi:hypothetical protein
VRVQCVELSTWRRGSRGRGFSQGFRGKDFQNGTGLFVGAESRGTSIPAERAVTIVKYCDLASADEEAPFAAIAVVEPGLPPKE